MELPTHVVKRVPFHNSICLGTVPRGFEYACGCIPFQSMAFLHVPFSISFTVKKWVDIFSLIGYFSTY